MSEFVSNPSAIVTADASPREPVAAQLEPGHIEPTLLLETLIELAPDAIFVANCSGSLIRVNARACQLLGYNRQELLGQAMADLSPDPLPATGGRLAQDNAQTQTYLHKDGSSIPVEVNAKLLPTGEWVAFVRDLRHRLQSEADHQAVLLERQQSEAEAQRLNQELTRKVNDLQTIFDALPVGVAIADDPSCQVIRANRYAESILMVPPGTNVSIGEAEGLEFKAYRNGEEVPPAEMPMQLAIAQGKEIRDMEIQIVRSNGATLDWLISAVPLWNQQGEVRGCVAAVTDIAALKQTEQALRDKEQQLQQLSDSMPQFVWMCNAQGELDYVNQRWIEYSGLTLAQTQDQTQQSDLVHPDDLQLSQEQWAAAVATQQPLNLEYRLKRASDGAYRWFLIRAVPVFDDQGQIQRWCGTSTDIHDRKLVELNEQFLNHLDMRLRQLTDVEAMAWEVVSSLGEYLNVDRCLWHEIDWPNRSTTVERTWYRPDMPDISGTWALDEYFTAEQLRAFAAGQTLVVSDVSRHAATARYAQNYLPLGAAFVSVPCIHFGRWVAVLAVNARTARAWQPHEVALLQETVARLWAIIERTRTTQALREQEERTRLATEAAQLGMWFWDLPKHELVWTDRCKALFGLKPDVQMSYEVFLQALHPDDRERTHAAVMQALEQQIEYDVEYRSLWSDGTVHWIAAKGQGFYNADGQPVRMMGTTQDIDDRKRRELNQQFLDDLERRLRQFSDAEAMVWEVVNYLGEYLHVDRCVWNEVDTATNQITVKQDWVQQPGLPSIVGVYHFSDFAAPELLDLYHQGQTVVVADVTTHPGPAAVVANSLLHSTAAYIAVPCVLQGSWVALLVVNSTTARNWRSDQVALVQETVARLGTLIQQTKTVQSLGESELRFRALADNIAQLAWITDADGWIFWYNQRWFDYTGTALEEMQGWGWQVVHHPDHLDRVVERFRHHIATGEIWEDTFPLRGKDGQYRWFLSRALPIRDQQGNIWRWFGTNTDITERLQAEADLQERNQYIQLLYETTRDLLSASQPLPLIDNLFAKLKPLIGLDVYFNYLLDQDQELLHLEFYGGISEAAASAIEWLEIGQAVCGTVAEQCCQIAQFDLQHSTDLKTELVKSLGLTAYCCQPLIAQGKLFGTLGFGSRSRTSFTTAETNLFQAICDQIAIALERSELMTSLQQQAEELRRTNRLKDDFLSALSHELRTPLNPILGWTKMLQAQKLTPEKTAHALQTIERNVKHQISLVDDLLDMSRVIQGKFRLDSHPVELVATLDSAIETVLFAAQAKAVTLRFDHPQTVYTIGDGDRLGQVFWNLLSNAIKFTPEGGQVEVELAQLSETGAGARPPAYAQVRVTDTGIGIAPEFMPHIFEYFRQAEGGSTRNYGGLGLGLAIARHLVELHGGTMTAESPGVGQGATFIVKLPLLGDMSQRDYPYQPSAQLNANHQPQEMINVTGSSSADSSPDHAAEDISPTPASQPLADISTSESLSGIQIVLVDDEPDNLELIRFVLSNEGASVTAFTSAAEALRSLVQSPPDLLISDIGMPHMNGYELIQQVRALPPHQGGEVVAVALTAFAQQADQERAIAAGYHAYIAKPIDPDAVVATVLKLIK